MLEVILFIISIILFGISFYFFSHTHKINQKIDLENKELQSENSNLKSHYNQLIEDCIELANDIEKKQKSLKEINSTVLQTVETQKELSQKAFENYCEVLENQYKEIEEEYDMYKDTLETSYSNRQLELLQEITEIAEDLNQIKATRNAAIQAQLKEKEIKENKDNYRLNISPSAQKDIKLLKSIQNDISSPIVIDKIIWSNYYQPLAKIKFPKIIGKPTTCGIYKLTSLISGSCYIGQSRDCCERWKQHCKNALNVGTTSTNNKLYNTIKEEGLNNFTFEIIEECKPEELDEKEKFYISLYDSYNFGLNGTKGNG